MGNQAKQEYLQKILIRYRNSSKQEKTRILDEFCAVCDVGRKHAIWLLSRRRENKKKKRVGFPKKYPAEALLPHIRGLLPKWVIL